MKISRYNCCLRVLRLGLKRRFYLRTAFRPFYLPLARHLRFRFRFVFFANVSLVFISTDLCKFTFTLIAYCIFLSLVIAHSTHLVHCSRIIVFVLLLHSVATIIASLPPTFPIHCFVAAVIVVALCLHHCCCPSL